MSTRSEFDGLDDRSLKNALKEAERRGDFNFTRRLQRELDLRQAAQTQSSASNNSIANGFQEYYLQSMQQNPGYTFSPQVTINKVITLKDTFKKGDYVYVGAPDDVISKNNVKKVFRVNNKSVVVEDEDENRTTVEGSAIHKLSSEKLEEYRKLSLVSFDSVIMSDDHRAAILEALKQVELSGLIFEEWGFKETMEKGKAISFLFYGEPGTGKTLTAQAIADFLGKKLEVIGTGEIQSSEPGQAERNIKAYFEKAGKDKVLLFDECDSLVHSRNNTGSIMAAQINALLTSLEQYEGVVIFTTNRLGVLDEAFNRRLSLKLEFPMPTVEERLQIWQRMFPKKAPLEKDIPWEKLAALELTGGYIKNIVLRAARSAAAQGHKEITYEVLKKAATHEVKSKREYEHAIRQHRRAGVTSIDEAIQDFGVSETNRLETKNVN